MEGGQRKVETMAELAKAGDEDIRSLDAAYVREAQKQRQITEEAARIQ